MSNFQSEQDLQEVYIKDLEELIKRSKILEWLKDIAKESLEELAEVTMVVPGWRTVCSD